jgi:hypothetical protein
MDPTSSFLMNAPIRGFKPCHYGKFIIFNINENSQGGVASEFDCCLTRNSHFLKSIKYISMLRKKGLIGLKRRDNNILIQQCLSCIATEVTSIREDDCKYSEIFKRTTQNLKKKLKNLKK